MISQNRINLLNEILTNKLYHNTDLDIENLNTISILHKIDLLRSSTFCVLDKNDNLLVIEYLENTTNKALLEYFKGLLIVNSW